MPTSQKESANMIISLCDNLVIKYRQMKTEYKECEEKLRITNFENDHFKSVTKYLEKSIGELLDHKALDGLLKNSHSSKDAVGLLEECGETLTRALCQCKQRAAELSGKLDRVRERPDDAVRRLMSRVDGMEATRAKRDRETAEWRSVERSMFVELVDSRRAEDQLHAALARLDDERALAERSAAEDADGMRADVERLTDELARRRAAVDVLRARAGEPGTARPSPPPPHCSGLKNHRAPPPQSRPVGSDRRPRDRNRSPVGRKSLDAEDGTATELGRGDANPRRPQSAGHDDGASSSSAEDDFGTCDGKSTGSSSTANVAAARPSAISEQEIPFLEFLELMNRNQKKPTAHDDDIDTFTVLRREL